MVYFYLQIWPSPHWQTSGTHLSGGTDGEERAASHRETISWHISSSSPSLCASFCLISPHHFPSLTKRIRITQLTLLLIKSRIKSPLWESSLRGRRQTQGHFQWQGLWGVCVCVFMCVPVAVCVCKIRPGKGEFQSFTGYQHWLLCCGAFKLAGLFIAFHNAPRTASVVCAEEGSQIKIRCQTELMYLQRRMASLQNLH